jgi:hypothetical protein
MKQTKLASMGALYPKKLPWSAQKSPLKPTEARLCAQKAPCMCIGKFLPARRLLGRISHVRFAPKSRRRRALSPCPLSATSSLMHCSKERRYSISSSAAANNLSGMVSPSALAVFGYNCVPTPSRPGLPSCDPCSGISYPGGEPSCH